MADSAVASAGFTRARSSVTINAPATLAAGLAALGGAALIGAIINPRQAALYALGTALGLVLYHAAFGFTSAWRVFITGSPYPGLRAFAKEESAIFFGRGREVDALISRLRDPAQRFLAVVGASGSGKSSLVRAGLLPRLEAGAIEESQNWRVLTFTPGAVSENPFAALAVELHRMLPAVHAQRPADLAKVLAASPQRLSKYAKEILANQPADAVLALFVDQFEELFTPFANSHRTSFVEFLIRAAADPHLRVIVTLRVDFLPQCAAEPALAELLQAGTFVLGAPGPAALSDMIRKPAERAGLDLEDGLADEIVKEAGGDPGALPLVAFCLEELYQQHGSERHLNLNHYRDTGGLRGVISRRVETLLVELQETEAAALDTILLQLFSALVHVDAAGKAVRKRASRDDLMAASPPVPELIEKLINGRLLLTEDEVGGRAVVMLAHEALLQEWPALSEWLGANQAQLQRLQRAFASLTSSAPNDRAYAVSTLGEIGPVTPEVVPALAAALGEVHEDAGVRRKAAEALGGIGSAAAAAVPALIAAMDDVDDEVRQSAAAALGEIGPAAAAAVPALIAALGLVASGVREDAGVCQKAAEVLGKIGPVTPEVVPALVAALGYIYQDVRWSAAEALGNIGLAAVPALIAALGEVHGNAFVRQKAVEVLGKIGPATPGVVPALVAAVSDANKDVRWSAETALRRIKAADVSEL